MAEDAERRQLEALWDVQLRRIGRSVVATPNDKDRPRRKDVGEWLGRMEDEDRATEARRFWYIFVAAILAVVVGIIAAWLVIHDWFR
jgi:hypothetical protein